MCCCRRFGAGLSFLILFVAAITFGVISHAPGGLGVIEATILFGLGAGTRPDAVAALVVFRLIYYLLPLCLAGLDCSASIPGAGLRRR